jgi:hypothetical protein
MTTSDLKATIEGARAAWGRTAPPAKRCRCGAPAFAGLGACDACLATSRRHACIRPALESVPPHYAWAALTAPEFEARVAPAMVIPPGAARQAAIGGAKLAATCLKLLGVRTLVVLGSKHGSGKTSLAAAMFRTRLLAMVTAGDSEEALHMAGRARFFAAYALARARATHPIGHGEAPDVQLAMTAPLVLLDDLGSEAPSYQSAIADVLYERFNQDRPTWATTWMMPSELATHYGAGIARRLHEGATVIRFPDAKP